MGRWPTNVPQRRGCPEPILSSSNDVYLSLCVCSQAPNFTPTCSTSSYYKNGDITIHSCFLVILCAHIGPHIHTHTPHRKAKALNTSHSHRLLWSYLLLVQQMADPSCLPLLTYLSRRGSSGELYREEQKQRNGRRGPVPDLATVPSSQATISLGNNAQPPKMGAHNMKNVYSEWLAQRRQEVLANPSIQVLCIFLLQRLSRCRWTGPASLILFVKEDNYPYLQFPA